MVLGHREQYGPTCALSALASDTRRSQHFAENSHTNGLAAAARQHQCLLWQLTLSCVCAAESNSDLETRALSDSARDMHSWGPTSSQAATPNFTDESHSSSLDVAAIHQSRRSAESKGGSDWEEDAKKPRCMS